MQLLCVEDIPGYRMHRAKKSRLVEWSGKSQIAYTSEQFVSLIAQYTSTLDSVTTPGEKVVILQGQTKVHTLAMEFAVIGLGCTACPVGYEGTADRVANTLSSLQPNRVYVDDPDRIPSFDHLPYDIERFPPPVESAAPENGVANRTSTPYSSSIALVITTSGTGGLPKGVALSNKALTSTILSTMAVSPLRRGQTVLSFLPISHIMERIMLYVAMVSGTDIHLAENPRHGFSILRQVQPHYFASVPRSLESVFTKFKLAWDNHGYFSRSVMHWALAQSKGENMVSRAVAKHIVLGRMKRIFGRRLKGILVGGAGMNIAILQSYEAAGIKIRQGYGLTEICGVATVNRFSSGEYNIRSVGLPVPGLELKIVPEGDRPDGTVWIKSPSLYDGYIVNGEMSPANLNAGWFDTGDIGYIDDRGFLYITGRKSDTFKNSYAEFVAPGKIEQQIRVLPGVAQCMVIGRGLPHTSALIIPDFEWLKTWCERNRVHWTDRQYMIHNPEVHKYYLDILDQLNSELERHEKVKGFALSDRPWTVENGLLTHTHKLRRAVILREHLRDVQSIYPDTKIDELSPHMNK